MPGFGPAARTVAGAPRWLKPGLAWLAGWWQLLHLGAVMGVLALTPQARRQARHSGLTRVLLARSVPVLTGFTVATALASLVVIRIVIVTAQSYGLSQFALEMVVRVLVLELIPLAAAMAAALQASMPMADDLASERQRGLFHRLRAQGHDPLAMRVLPRLLAGLFAVALLAAMSCVVTLVLAYVSANGFTLGGFERYTRTVGRVFSPTVSVIFVLKVLALGLAVAWIPLATVLMHRADRRSRASAELQGLVRLFLVVLLIEAASLVGNYH